MKRHWIYLGLALAAGAGLLPAEWFGVQAGDKTAKPNIVVILADDLGYGDPGCYHQGSKIPTPNIDRLAKQGMRFTDMHAPASVCTPTRYGIMTGRYCWRTNLKKGVLQGYDPLLVEMGRLTLATLLKQLKYFTACIGKWHLGLGEEAKTDYAKLLKPGPKAVGFDYFFGIPASLDMIPYVFVENEKATAAPTAMIAASKNIREGGPGFWRGGPIAPGFVHEQVMPTLTKKAVDLIRKQWPEKPFFLYFPMTAPHMPELPTKNFRGKSQVGPYGDFVMQMDDTVGQVLKALDDAKLADNTLVIFTSDNGGYWTPLDIEKYGHRSNGLLRGQKADIWEGGHRIPFIARWPGKIQAGSTSAETLCLTDLLATTAAIVDAKLPENAAEDSFNFLPVLLGQKRDRPVREALIHQSYDGTLAIRSGPWRLTPVLGSHGFSEPRSVVAKEGEAAGELFDLGKDLGEKDNRWLEEPEVVRRLSAALEKIKSDGRIRAK